MAEAGIDRGLCVVPGGRPMPRREGNEAQESGVPPVSKNPALPPRNPAFIMACDTAKVASAAAPPDGLRRAASHGQP